MWLAVRAVVLLALIAPATAGASAQDVFRDMLDGQLNPCSHSEADLRSAVDNIPNDLAQYAPELRSYLQAAIEYRASGGCDHKATTTTQPAPTQTATATPPASGSGGGTTPPASSSGSSGSGSSGSVVQPPPTPPASGTPNPIVVQAVAKLLARDQQDSNPSAPAPLVALGVLGALLALLASMVLAVRALSTRFAWAARMRHAWGEAAYRSGAIFSEFADWVRLGH